MCDQICIPEISNIPEYKCNCFNGFLYKYEENSCSDIDECSVEHLNTCKYVGNSECQNDPGGYHCRCRKGYEFHNDSCRDINECETLMHSCDLNSWCINTNGSYECQCEAGFDGDGLICINSTNGLQIEIPNWCSSDNSCGINSTCFNTEAGPICQCILNNFWNSNKSCGFISPAQRLMLFLNMRINSFWNPYINYNYTKEFYQFNAEITQLTSNIFKLFIPGLINIQITKLFSGCEILWSTSIFEILTYELSDKFFITYNFVFFI